MRRYIEKNGVSTIRRRVRPHDRNVEDRITRRIGSKWLPGEASEDAGNATPSV